MTGKSEIHSLFALFLFASTLQAVTPVFQRAYSGGIIRGKVTVTSEDRIFEEIMNARSMNRYDEHAKLIRDPVPYSLSEKAVVYIENIGGMDQKASEKRARLDQQDMMFRPLVLPIVVGTTVSFPNNDDLFHNVFSYSRAGEFDLGRYPRGESRTVTFKTPGVVPVYCDLHAYMYATILVLENSYFASPDDNGNYVISGVPPGTYQLGFWYGKKKVDSRTVKVTDGESTSVDFVF